MSADRGTEIFATGGFVARAFATPRLMGAAAAADLAAHLCDRLAQQDQVRVMFAAAPSQAEMLSALIRQPGIDWRRIAAFHMDEYVGLARDHPARFGNWLRRHIWDQVAPGSIHTIDPGPDPAATAAAYARLLAEAPLDVVCLGIGINGHIAFNDPPDADFHDPLAVKPIALDLVSRRQQVSDECFATLDEVPATAVTVTIPALMAGRRLFATVPGAHKRDAVRRALYGPLTDACPASILRTHPACTLYLDAGSTPEAREP
jgi:glucosamine-6-phosphate deaminase